MSSAAAIRSACEEAGYNAKTVGVYMKLLAKLLAKYHSDMEGDVFGMLRQPEWVENTLKEMYSIKSMPTYLGYIVSMLKAWNSNMKLKLGKRKPQEVDAWMVYFEKAAYYRGMWAGMTSPGSASGMVDADDDMWKDSVEVQASVDTVDASTQLDEYELDDYVVPETPLSQQVPPTQAVGDIEFRELPAAPMKRRKVADADSSDTEDDFADMRKGCLEFNSFEEFDAYVRTLPTQQA